MSTQGKLATVTGIPLPEHRTGRSSLESPVPSFLRRVRWRRFLTRILRVAAILAVSYLLIANVLLRTRLLRNAISGKALSFAISGNTSAIDLDYDSAYSILPGRVHVEGLTIRGRERTVEWFVALDRADVAISLHDLLHRSFHATRVRASGLAIRARPRLERADATPEVIAAMPPIAGFADPPLLDAGPKPPPLTDANYKLWMVELEDVDVEHVREVWIHTMRSEGDTRVRGRWVFRPQRWLDVGPATVDANGVDVSYAGHPIAAGIRGSFGATVHAFDVRQAKGFEIFDHVSYRGELHGQAIVAGVLRSFPPRSGVSFTRWEGPLDSYVVLDHGKLVDGTRVRIDAADGEIEADGLAFAGPIRTELGVDGDLGTVDARVSGLRVSRLGVEQARVASIAAAVTSRHLLISRFFDDARFTLDVGGAETNDVAAWKRFFPATPTFVIRSGTVTAHGHAEGSLADRRGRAAFGAVARGLTVERGSDRFTADVVSDADLVDISVPGRTFAGTATITAGDLEARLGDATLSGKLATHVTLRHGNWGDRKFDLSGSDVVLRAVTVRSARGAAAIVVVPSLKVSAKSLTIAPSGVDGLASIDLPRADLVDLRRLPELLPLPTGLAVDDGRGQAKLRADVELGSGAVRGDGEIVARGIRGRASSTSFFGDLDLVLRARRTGAAGATELSGSTLAIRRAGTGDGAPPQDAWWANAALREATLRTRGGVRFDAKAHLEAKDASPATVLVSQNTSTPAWAANIFRMPALDADAQVRVGPASIEVLSLVARGGGNSVRAEYAKRDGRQDGAVLLDLGWIDVGYDLSDGATGLVILGPQAWFRRKTASMRDAAGAANLEAEAAEQLARYAAMTPVLRKEEARAFAARCTLEVRACDGASVEQLLRTATAPGERDALSGIAYAPIVVAAAKGGTDGATLDPRVVGSVAEALRIGGESTLEHIPSLARVATDPGAARGKVIAVTGRASSLRREGAYSVGTLTTDAEPVYFVTPFATQVVPETLARFRGVFVQRYAPTDLSPAPRPSLVLVGVFGPRPTSPNEVTRFRRHANCLAGDGGVAMKGFVQNIEGIALDNVEFRRVLYTAKNCQLVVMALAPNEEIGAEVHKLDQFFRVEEGTGEVVLDGVRTPIRSGFAVLVPAEAEHNIINTGTAPMKLYTLYAPPNHRDGVVHRTRAGAEADSEHFDGKTTE